MTNTLILPDKYLTTVCGILEVHLPQAEIWAYGSRVRGDCYDASDLDLVVRQPNDLLSPQPHLDRIRDAFSQSNLPIFVQIVDWALIPEAFRQEILACYISIQPAKNSHR